MLLLSLSTVVIAGIVSSYTLYYFLRKVSKPQLSCGQGTFRSHLLEHCPILQQPYWPTWWAFNRHVMTIARSVLQKGLHLKYKRLVHLAATRPQSMVYRHNNMRMKLNFYRETTSPDDNTLDWYYTDSNNTDLKEDAPILLILPGTSCKLIFYYFHVYIVYVIAANTKTPIIHWLVYDGILQNYRPVVMNYRGSCGVPLKVEYTYIANRTSDY